MKREIQFSELPLEAQEGISEEQRSYSDEFSFYWKDGFIEAWYAGELLALWDGNGWQH